jgi:hypothetical protein
MDPATKRLAIFATVIGTSLLGLVAVWAFTGHHSAGVPVVEADSRPLKSKPANPGGLQVEGANDSILSGETDGKETVAPGPESPAPQALKAQEQAAAQAATPAQPAATAEASATTAASTASEPPRLPPLRPHPAVHGAVPPAGSTANDGTASIRLIPSGRPAGPLASVEAAPPRSPAHAATALSPSHHQPLMVAQATTTPTGEDQAPSPAPAQLAPIQSTPLQAPAAQPTTPTTSSVAPNTAVQAAPPAGAPAAEPPPAAAHAAAAAHGKRALVQFAAVDSGEAALREWQRLSKKYPDLLGNRTPNITKTEHDGKTFWRIRTGGFTDLTQATLFCQKVKSRGGTCTVASF